MSAVETFDVIPHKLEYWPGETMTGKVVLKVKNGSLQSQGIYLNFKGLASIDVVQQWVNRTTRHSIGRSSDGSRHSHTSTHVNVTSFNNTQNLMSVGSFLVGDGQTLLNLGEGEVSYPFSIPLPSRLVSSYVRNSGPLPYRMTAVRGSGNVSYYFELGMKVPGSADFISRKGVSIHTNLDLSSVPEAFLAGEAEVTRTFVDCNCCFGSATGPLTLKLRTPKRGYLPGETIPFEVGVINKSGKNIKGLSAQIIEIAILIGPIKRQNVVNVIPSGTHHNLQDAGAEHNWQGEIVVPPEGQVFPSKLGGGCSIIDLDYFIQIVAYVDGWCNGNVEVMSSIIIGTCRSSLAQLTNL